MSALLESLLTDEQRSAAVSADEKAALLERKDYGVRGDATDAAQTAALNEALACPDVVADWLYGECMSVGPMPDAADRVLRVPGRIEAADVPTVLAAAMVSAYRGDMQTAGECLHELSKRYVDKQVPWILTRAGEMS